MPGAFANPNVHVQSWYVLGRSSDVRRRQIKAVEAFGRRLIQWRTSGGELVVTQARCPHLGADLARGRVIGETVQCSFHGWHVNRAGRCRDRSVRTYPVLERWGLIWVFNGPTPLFELPHIACKPRLLPAQEIRCHPHLVIANGLDATHLDPLHDIHLTHEPAIEVQSPRQLSVTVSGHPRSMWLRWATGTQRTDFKATFTALGGSLGLARFVAPEHFTVLFTGRGSDTCITQTLVFNPRPSPVALARTAATLFMLLRRDRPALDTLDFAPDFAASDEPLRTWAHMVDGMPTW